MAGFTLLLGPGVSGAGAQSGAAVEIDVEAGLGNVIGERSPVPVHVTLTSDRSRTVDVVLRYDTGQVAYRVELNRDTARSIDHVANAGKAPSEIVVSDGGRTIGQLRPSTNQAKGALIGTFESVPLNAALDVPLLDGAVVASLYPVRTDWLERPGAVEHLDGLIATPDSFAGLDEATRARVSQWLWNGGDLAISGAAPATDPFFDRPTTGAVTTLGAGRLRYVGDAVAAADWSTVVQAPLGTVKSWSADANNQWQADISSELGWRGLIDRGPAATSRSLSVILVLAMVVIGPGVWFVLRRLRRPHLMWFVAPAAAVLISGAMASFGAADGDTGTAVMYSLRTSTPVGTSQASFTAVNGSNDSTLPEGWVPIIEGNLTYVDGDVMRSDGDRAQWSPIVAATFVPSDAAAISVRATPAEGDRVAVEVTNHTDRPLSRATVAGFGRSRDFGEVEAGATKTLEFETATDIETWAGPFGWGIVPEACIGDCNVRPNFYGFPLLQTELSIGVIRISGTLGEDTSDVFSSSRPQASLVTALTTVEGWDEQLASPAPRSAFMVEPVSGQANKDEMIIRIAALASVDNVHCSLPTFATTPQLFDGGRWNTLQALDNKVFPSDRFTEPLDMFTYDLGAMTPATPKYLRVVPNEFNFTLWPSHVLCGVKP